MSPSGVSLRKSNFLSKQKFVASRVLPVAKISSLTYLCRGAGLAIVAIECYGL
jgi:hypothetical protein